MLLFLSKLKEKVLRVLYDFFYVSVSVHHKLIHIKNQRDATWHYVY